MSNVGRETRHVQSFYDSEITFIYQKHSAPFGLTAPAPNGEIIQRHIPKPFFTSYQYLSEIISRDYLRLAAQRRHRAFLKALPRLKLFAEHKVNNADGDKISTRFLISVISITAFIV